jgi:hypothetical protein
VVNYGEVAVTLEKYVYRMYTSREKCMYVVSQYIVHIRRNVQTNFYYTVQIKSSKMYRLMSANKENGCYYSITYSKIEEI